MMHYYYSPFDILLLPALILIRTCVRVFVESVRMD